MTHEQYRELNNVLIQLAKRKDPTTNSWLIFLVRETVCVLCGRAIQITGGRLSNSIIKHGLAHAKEHNILVFL